MIKLKLRRNLFYLFIYYLSWYLRKIADIFIENIFGSISAYIFLFLMNLGEIFGGLTLYLYQYNSWKQKKQSKYFGINLLFDKNGINPIDGQIKRGLLMFLASFFDFMEFVIASFHVPKLDPDISQTLDLRLGSITTLFSSFLCIYALKIKISKHHRVSLIVLSFFLFLSLLFEIIYKQDNINFGRFIFARLLTFMDLMCISMTDCTEKYLVDSNFLSPFKIVMMEGIFEIIIASILSIGEDPFKEINKHYKEQSAGKFILLIFLLFLHLFFSAIVNTYKIYCNVIYSPMARSLADYFMTPFFIIYYYAEDKDFQNNFLYFFISLIISLIIDFFSCVYNEYIILYCFDLEYNTIDEISERASTLVNAPKHYILTEDDDDEGSSNNNIGEEFSIYI